jgi:hypothetical protein
MEIAKMETTGVVETLVRADHQLVELADLQLALVGGGVGEVVFG